MKKVLFACVALAISTVVFAQPYPSRPIRLVVGFPPGGAADFVSRAFQEPLGKALGQPIVVENRPGAGSSIAAEHVARSAPDGYTVLIASPKVSSSPLILSVNPGVGVNSVKELIAHAQKNPGKLNFASSGNGSAPHLAAVLFMRLANVEMVHVPYKGGGPAVQSVLAGDTQLVFATPRTATPLLPGIAGMGEAGLPDYEISFWYGFFVPAGTPAEVVRKLFDATSQVVKLPETARILAREGTETSGSASPDEFAGFLAEDAKLWARLVKDSGAKAD